MKKWVLRSLAWVMIIGMAAPAVKGNQSVECYCEWSDILWSFATQSYIDWRDNCDDGCPVFIGWKVSRDVCGDDCGNLGVAAIPELCAANNIYGAGNGEVDIYFWAEDTQGWSLNPHWVHGCPD